MPPQEPPPIPDLPDDRPFNEARARVCVAHLERAGFDPGAPAWEPLLDMVRGQARSAFARRPLPAGVDPDDVVSGAQMRFARAVAGGRINLGRTTLFGVAARCVQSVAVDAARRGRTEKGHLVFVGNVHGRD